MTINKEIRHFFYHEVLANNGNISDVQTPKVEKDGIQPELKILADLKKYYLNESLSKFHLLSKMEKINLFVGANNAGKSRLLRAIIKFLVTEIAGKKKKTIGNLAKRNSHLENSLKRIREDLYTTTQDVPILYLDDGSTIAANTVSPAFSISHDFDIVKAVAEDSPELQKIQQLMQMANLIIERKYATSNETEVAKVNSFATKKILDDLALVLSHINCSLMHDYEIIYTPVLRGITYLTEKEDKGARNLDNLYEETVIRNYFNSLEEFTVRSYDKNIDIKKFFRVNTGFSLYHDIKTMLLGKQEYRTKIQDYQKFLSERVFDGQEVTLIPYHQGDSESDHTLWVKIGDGPDREIFNLGDGVQSLIILTFPMFIYDKGLFFIEEPELHIHPGMQRKFVDILKYFAKSKNKEHQYFITTHSNHFLDLTLDIQDISVFNLEKHENEFKISLASSGDRDTLDLLGVQNTSVFLSNCVIWAEGPSDRLYFKKFLQLLLENENKYKRLKNVLQEGIHYSFVFSGGSTISHLNFSEDLEDLLSNPSSSAKFILDRSLVIVDNDENKDKKESSKVKLREQLGEDFYDLKQAIETENLLPYSAILKGIKAYDTWAKVPDEIFYQIVPAKQDIPQSHIYITRLGTLIEDELIFKVNPNNEEFVPELAEGLPKKIKLNFADKAKSTKTKKDDNDELEEVDEVIPKSEPSEMSNPQKNTTRTLKDKMTFARHVCEQLEWSEISVPDEEGVEFEAIVVAKLMLKFILENNQDLKKLLVLTDDEKD